MKIILATAPRAQGEIEMAGFPFLGIGYVAAYLEQKGKYNVAIVDAHTERLNVEQTAQRILSFKPEAVGFTATTHNRFHTINVIKNLKKQNPSLFIFAGGPHFALSAEDALKIIPEIDVIVRGEGEITTKELLDIWPDESALKNVLGITYKNKHGEIIVNPDRPFLKDWTELPSPAWHLYDLSKYNKSIFGTNFKTTGVISARGCPNLCTFCANAAFSKACLRLRSAKNFVDELELLHRDYGFSAFNFWDDTLTISKNRVEEICNELIMRRLDFKWYATARVNTVDQEIIDLMKRAGCVRISFGIESGSPRILKTVKKGITVEQAREAVKISSDADLIVSLNFIVNLPEETMEDLKMTVNLMKEMGGLKNVSANYGFALIYPGTEMEQFAKDHGIMARDFSWNSFYEEPKARLTGEDSSVPCMEWPGKELEKVKAFMVKNLVGREDIFKKGWQKLKRVKSAQELKSLLKAGWRYLGA